LVGQSAEGTYLSPSQLRTGLNTSIDNIVDIALSTRPDDRHDSPSDMLRNIELIFLDSLWEENKKVDHGTLFKVVGAGFAILLILALVFLFRPVPEVIDPMDADNTLRVEVLDEIRQTYPDDASYEKLLADAPSDAGPMIYIPAGPVVSGNFEMEFAEQHARKGEPKAEKIPRLDAFYIDKYEFPNQERSVPTVLVDYEKAKMVCAAVGKQLCTQYQWERACRGPNSQLYGYHYEKYNAELDEYNPSVCGKSQNYLLGGIRVPQQFEDWLEVVQEAIDLDDEGMSLTVLAQYLDKDLTLSEVENQKYLTQHLSNLKECLAFVNAESNQKTDKRRTFCVLLENASEKYRSQDEQSRFFPQENCETTEKTKTKGVYGLSAGPREWTSTQAKSSPDKHIVKGGEVGGAPERIYRCSFSSELDKTAADSRLSFRCCKTVTVSE